MPCKLKLTTSESEFTWSAATGSVVTLRLLSDNSLIIGAQYNGQEIPVQDNAVSFTVGNGDKHLSLAFAGPVDTGEGRPPKGRPATAAMRGPAKIIEECGNGQAQSLFDGNELQPVLVFTIVGV